MTDFPAQTDPTTAADSTEAQSAEAHSAETHAVDAGDVAQPDAVHDDGGDAAAVTRIRNNASLAASRGTTTIANEVVEKIAGIAARDVPGVYDLGGDTVRLLSSVREKLHLGDESKAQGIAVKLNGKKAELSITIVLEYGFVVSFVDHDGPVGDDATRAAGYSSGMQGITVGG